MLSKEFLQDYPLYRKFNAQLPENLYQGSPPRITTPAIRLYCPVCALDHTFTTTLILIGTKKHKGQPEPSMASHGLISGRLALVESSCVSCNDYCQFFILYFDEELKYVTKVGQFPSWSITVGKHLVDILGEHESTYKKGLICESQGYGIGAYAYYRRIVENIIDDLLQLIKDLLDDNEQKEFDEAVRNIQASTVAKEKIEAVKDLLPAKIRPDGMNPLSLLHETLSKGIHSMSDEECLEAAGDIRKVLTYLVEQISLANEAKQSSYEFTQSMRNLLAKRSKST
jgi:hypothetical protein